ncbi:MAG TPA: FimV/HubP family polar landmark protein [Candidatus Competibacteraceae bacterium]|nr:FimV/HubP family polar landmark protein [Candidatus Competibacteraceae bacterium]
MNNLGRASRWAVLALLLAGAPALADFRAGVEAFSRGDYDTAYREFKTLAEQEHADAQNNLGVMYNTGKGVPQDYLEAAKWYRRAAEQGHVDAQNNLGALYAQGHGVPRDDVMAYVWFEQAAQKGDQGARRNRDFVAARMSAQQLSEAKKLSITTTTRLANLLPARKAADAATAKPVAQAVPQTSAAKPATPTTVAAAPTPAPTAAVTPAAAARPLTAATAPVTAMTAPGATVSVKPLAPVVVNPAAAAAAVAKPVVTPAAALSAGGGRSHGPVAPGETLWSIAKRYAAGTGVSIEQMVLAIQRTNPQAFASPSINSMKVGSTLRIPSVDEAARTPREQARQEVRRQLGG